MNNAPLHHNPVSPSLRGFTLIELLVVIAIVGILVAMSVLVFGKVTQSGRTDQTRNILKTLDQALTVFGADRDVSRFPSVYKDETGTPNEWPIIDARLSSAGFDRAKSTNPDLPEPTVQLFLLATGENASVLSAVNGIEGTFKDSTASVPAKAAGRLVQQDDVYSTAFGANVKQRDGVTNIKAARVRDPWGNDIRMVHPRFHGGHGDFYAQSSGSWSSQTRGPQQVKVKRAGVEQTFDFRRAANPFNPTTPPAGVNPVGDADEGLCAGTRPYFYSAGPDHDPGLRDDNVYVDRPQFPKESQAGN